MLKAGLEALARLQLEGYHAQPAASTQQQQQQQPHEQAAQQQPGSAEHGNEEQGPLPLHELPSDVLGKIIMVSRGVQGRDAVRGPAERSTPPLNPLH